MEIVNFLLTSIVTSSLYPPALFSTTIVVVPLSLAVTTPFSSTLAILGLLDV
nr:hypothetical protein [Clostridium sp.]